MSGSISIERPWGRGRIALDIDAVANDNDKTLLTVPAGKVDVVDFVYVTFASSATVGNRLIRLTISNATPAVVFTQNYATAQAASLTYTYLYMSGMGTPAGAGTQTLPFPSGLRLTAGCSIRVWDVNNIDAAADDMTTVVSYVEYDA